MSLFPFLNNADGKFSVWALLGFLALVLAVMMLLKRVPALKSLAAV